MRSSISRRSAVKSAWLGLLGFSARAAHAETLEVGGSKIEVVFEKEEWRLPKTVILEWVAQCARAVAAYYGGLPVPSARLRLSCENGRHGILHGRTFGFRGAETNLAVGQETTQAELNEDW